MHNSISKKLLAGALSVMMVLSLVAPSGAQAASSYSFKQKSGLSKLTADKAYTYYVKGVKSTQYVKVARTYKDVLVKKGDTVVKKTTKVKGTGKTITLKVTAPDKVKNYKNTLKVKVYNKKTNKLVKTLKRTATIKVKALKITNVEPTTAADTKTGYKYIRVNFSKALSSISAGDIELRAKSTNQLYTVDSAKLANNGKSADIVIKGDASVAGTTFLMPGNIYTVNFSQNGVTASLQFELPNFADEQTVTSVDTSKKMVYIGNVGFKVPAKYDGNLGELVGRTVTFGFNSDLEMSSLSVKDETVVYGDMTYNAATSTDKAHYYDNKTGKTYGFNDVATTSNAVTRYFNAANGKEIAPASGHYVKLVMNTNGTVRTAVIESGLSNRIVVTSVKGTTVTQDKKNAVNFDGYTVEKDGKYISVADLKAGDVVYYDTTGKFADVYSEKVTGTMTTTYSDATTIDGKKIKGDNWQYLDAATGLYTAASEEYLLKLDATKPVTLTLNRAGKAVLVAGTETNAVTSGYYVVTKVGTPFTDKDGKGYTLYLSNGEAKTMVARENSWKGTTTTFNGIAGVATDAALVKVSTNAKGEVTNVEAQDLGAVIGADAAATAQANSLDTTAVDKLDSKDTLLTANGIKYNMSSTTPVYVISTQDTHNANLRTVTKTTLGQLDGSYAAAAAAMGTDGKITYIQDKSNVTAILVTGLTNSSTVVSTKTGLLKTLSQGTNTKTGISNELRDITLYTKDGVTKFDAVEGQTEDYNVSTGNPDQTWSAILTAAKDNYIYVTLGLDKDGKVAKVEADPIATSNNVKSGSTGTQELTMDDATLKTISATDDALVIDVTEDAYALTTIGDINTKTAVGSKNITAKTITYHKALGDNNNVIADVIIVKYTLAGSTPSVAGTITQDAAGTTLTANIPTGKLVKSFQWYKDGDATGMGTAKTQVVNAMATYSCVLTFSDGTTSTMSYKPTQVVTTVTATAEDDDQAKANNHDFSHGTISVVDQFGGAITGKTVSCNTPSVTVTGYTFAGSTLATGVTFTVDGVTSNTVAIVEKAA